MLYPQFKGVPLEAYNRMVDLLKARARQELKLSDSELVVRPLRPEDIGFANPVFNSTVAASGTLAWSNLVNTYTIADNRFVGVNGVFADKTRDNLTQIKVTRSGKTTRLWSVQQVRDFEDKIAYADDPFTVGQNEQITIERYATTKVGDSMFGFVGVVIEKRGLTINPSSY